MAEESRKREWSWAEDEPAVVVTVVLVLALLVLFPHHACRGDVTAGEVRSVATEVPSGAADPDENGGEAQPNPSE